MTILCAGISHRTAKVEIREKFAVNPHELRDTLSEVCSLQGLRGAVIVSTCNRVEYYTASASPLVVVDELLAYLKTRTGIETSALYTHQSPDCIRHLFRVASGLESMVLGETEILGQLKQAYAAASEYGTTTVHLNKLFQHAFRVAKQVRSETHITRGATSVGAVAVELAGKIFGDLRGKKIMVLGAGDTSERTARSLVSRGVETVLVANRTLERAEKLAQEIGGAAVSFDTWHNFFNEIDILICSTSAPHPVVTVPKLSPSLALRHGKPLFIIDLAVPRDAEPALNQLDNVYLYDMDSLEKIVDRSLEVRRAEVIRCEEIIDCHVQDFVKWMDAHNTR